MTPVRAPDNAPELVQALVESYVLYARKLARQFRANVAPDQREDELEAAALEGLHEAARHYRPDQYASRFTTYAYPVIRGRMHDLVRRTHRERSRRVVMSAAYQAAADVAADIDATTATPTTAAEAAARFKLAGQRVVTIVRAALAGVEDEAPAPSDTPPEQAAAEEDRRFIRRAVDELPPDEGDVVRQVFFDGRSVADVARQKGVHRGTALRQLQRGLDLLRERLGPEQLLQHAPGRPGPGAGAGAGAATPDARATTSRRSTTRERAR